MDGMSQERWRKIESVFRRAIDLAGAQRESFLDEATRGDPPLREAVMRLLTADAASDGFMSVSAGEQLRLLRGGAPGSSPVADKRPLDSRIGPYRLVKEIGRGGMGIVYLAERVDGQFEERVCVKLLRRGLDSDDVFRRFLQERQILAWLRHPNIASILDGGLTDDGLPYFVMEYVDGKPITLFCDESALGTADRLRLFRQVCQGVQHAHQNLVVHRDLKPSNILVDTQGRVKLLDFGVAKLLAPRADAFVTGSDRRLLTPQYAAPEQIRGEPVTTATDVYALGVVLYELLTGRLPYRVTGATMTEIERMIIQSDPDRASAIVGRSRLRRALAGDLDNILMKTLRKAPRDRYDTAVALEEDIDRHLRALPVAAHAPSLRYRAGRFVRRHVVGVSTTAIVALAMLGGTAGVMWQSAKTARQARKAEAVRDFLVSVFEVANPNVSRGEPITARQMLDHSSGRIEELRKEPEVQAQIMRILGGLYYNLGVYAAAESLLTRALDIQRVKLAPGDIERAWTLDRLMAVHIARGDLDGAERSSREALAIARKTLSLGDGDLALFLNDFAVILKLKGEIDESERLQREALNLRRKAFGPKDKEVASTLNNLGTLRMDRGDLDDADRLFREALEIRRADFGETSLAVAITLHNLMVLNRQRGNLDEAEPLAREALAIRRKILGERHADVGSTLFNLAAILHARGDIASAEPAYRKAIEITRATRGADNPEAAAMTCSLAKLLRQRGEAKEAEAIDRDALSAVSRRLPRDHPVRAVALLELGECLLQQGGLAEAESLMQEALAIRRTRLGSESIHTADARFQLGKCLTRLGRYNQARAQVDSSIATFRARVGPASSRTLEVERFLEDLGAASDSTYPCTSIACRTPGIWPAPSRTWMLAPLNASPIGSALPPR
jgi:serine/threonine-protein kinase